MYPRSAAPRGRTTFTHGPHPPPSVPRFNHPNLAGVNSFFIPGLERLPPYVWTPIPTAIPAPPPRTPTPANSRKRQNDECSPPGVKRQRVDATSHSFVSPSFIRAPPPHRPDQVVEGSSRSGFDTSHPSLQSQRHPQPPAVPQSCKSLQTYASDKLSSQMVEIFEACQQQDSDLARKETCRAQLQQDIQRVYPGTRLYLTGSSMNGLGCRSSDADLCLVLKETKRYDSLHTLSVLQRLFKSLSYIGQIQLIRAKVSILRFREKGSRLEFDLNINSTAGIRNTFLLRSYAYADLRIRPMILVVKKWAQHIKINDASKGTLNSYALVLMVLHYLQTLKEPVLPSLQKDFPDCFNPLMAIDMVPEASKYIPPYNSRNQSSLGDLLLGFLSYYAFFRWDEQVISVREAKALPKRNCHESRNTFIHIEEPFEGNNVARAVHEKIKFDTIKAQFVKSFRILQEKKDLNSILPVRTVINQESSRR